MVVGTAVVRWAAKKGKPKMKPMELTRPPEQSLSISRAIFQLVKDHGPLSISDAWQRLKGLPVPVPGLTSKTQLKLMLRWMRERQKLRQICCHNGPHKHFLYTTWFSTPPPPPPPSSPTRKKA